MPSVPAHVWTHNTVKCMLAPSILEFYFDNKVRRQKCDLENASTFHDNQFCFVSSQLQVWFLICNIIEHVVKKLSLYLDRWILESLANRDHELQLSWASVTGIVMVSSTQTHTAEDWAFYAMLTYTHSMTLTGRISR